MENKNQTKVIIEPQHIHCIKFEFSYLQPVLNHTPMKDNSPQPIKLLLFITPNVDQTLWEQNTVNPVNLDTEGAIESICINGVSILNISRLNLEKM